MIGNGVGGRKVDTESNKTAAKMTIGTRTVMLVCGCLPMYFATAIMPYLAIFLGSIELPNIMLCLGVT